MRVPHLKVDRPAGAERSLSQTPSTDNHHHQAIEAGDNVQLSLL